MSNSSLPDMPSETHGKHQCRLSLSCNLTLETIPSSDQKYWLHCGESKCSGVDKIHSPWPQGIFQTEEKEIANEHKNKCITIHPGDCWRWEVGVHALVRGRGRGLMKRWLRVQRRPIWGNDTRLPSQTTKVLKSMSPEIIQTMKLYKVPTYWRMI